MNVWHQILLATVEGTQGPMLRCEADSPYSSHLLSSPQQLAVQLPQEAALAGAGAMEGWLTPFLYEGGYGKSGREGD